jgi:hypothetical protein
VTLDYSQSPKKLQKWHVRPPTSFRESSAGLNGSGRVRSEQLHGQKEWNWWWHKEGSWAFELRRYGQAKWSTLTFSIEWPLDVFSASASHRSRQFMKHFIAHRHRFRFRSDLRVRRCPRAFLRCLSPTN